MNFLAHLYLSGDQEEVMIGNFIGDFVRGRDIYSRYSFHLALGIELHREIDEFTDSHPVVLESKVRLRPKYRHYAPVIVDMFYDHFLAANWNSYHSLSLSEYADRAYRLIQKNTTLLPDRVNQMMPYMVRGNWLVNYAQLEGVQRALTGMSQRTPYNSKMDEAVVDLKENYAVFEKEFTTFFPLLQKHCRHWLDASTKS